MHVMTHLLYADKGNQYERRNNDSDTYMPGNEFLRAEDNYNDDSHSASNADDEIFPCWVFNRAEKELAHISL